MSSSQTEQQPSSSSSSSPITISSLDHLVLTVRDIEKTIAWYTEYLNMTHQVFTSPKDPSVQRHSLVFSDQKINLHLSGAEFEPKAQHVQPGSGDLCLLVDRDVEAVVLPFLRARGVRVLEGGGVVERVGARGRLKSLYVRDPDGNLIELSNYI